MIKSFCEINGVKDVRKLNSSMDFRNPIYRREVFIRLYGFHTSLGIHPGLVYLYLPEICNRLNLDIEQRFWLAFLEGCTENPCTAYQIIKHVPRLPRTPVRMSLFERWHKNNWHSLCYDIDTRYNKGHLVEQTKSYIELLGNSSQLEWFSEGSQLDPKEWFDVVWDKCVKIFKFGRLTTWSYLEFVKICTGLQYEYSSLKMNDLSGSKSHRNGLLKVLGRDDLEWWSKLNNGVTTHSKELCADLEVMGGILLQELRDRYKDEDWCGKIGFENLESTLCLFKNCFRGYRYPNIYTDMSYDRIKKAEKMAPEIDFSIFWDIRKERLPKKLLLECNPRDIGLKPTKQQFFMNSGKLPMMSVYDDVFTCDWDKLLD